MTARFVQHRYGTTKAQRNTCVRCGTRRRWNGDSSAWEWCSSHGFQFRLINPLCVLKPTKPTKPSEQRDPVTELRSALEDLITHATRIARFARFPSEIEREHDEVIAHAQHVLTSTKP